MNTTNKTITLNDGRIIGYNEFGDTNGKPLFYFHGSGAGSGFFAENYHSVALQNGIRIIAPDRPGIGYSDFQENRTILGWSKDMDQIAKALHVSTFSIVSESGGSAYALACAHQMPGRLGSVSIVSGICPIDAPFARDSLTVQNRIMFSMFKRGPGWLLKSMFKNLQNGIQSNPDKFFSNSAKRMSEAEKKIVLNPEYQKVFIKSVLSAFQQGYAGPVKDIRLGFGNWGFSIEDISSKVHVWHGMDDNSAPRAMAKYLEETIPNAKANYLENEGHSSVLPNHSQEIFGNI